MNDVTLHPLDDYVQTKRQDQPLVEGSCALLRAAVPPRPTTGAELVALIRAPFIALGGVDLELPPRDLPRPLDDHDVGRLIEKSAPIA